jgi:hypothetical protein
MRVRINPTMVRARFWLRSISRIFILFAHTVSERLISPQKKKSRKQNSLSHNGGGGGEWRGAIVAPLISCRNPYLKRLPAPLLSRSPLSMRFLSFCERAGYLRRRYVPCTLLFI